MADVPKISCVIRSRPPNSSELARGDENILEFPSEKTITVKEYKEKVDLTKYIERHNFTFDQAIDSDVGNEEVYERCVQPLITAAFEGAKVTCFAYGQTGSGKTYTMMGPGSGDLQKMAETPGMYLLAGNDIFTLLDDPTFEGFSIRVSFYEIYCAKLYDLLNKRTELHCRTDAKQRVKVVNLTETNVTDIEELMNVIHYGLSCRQTGTTAANSESSRSHAILQISIKNPAGKQHGKLSFIDLAGSERGADHMNQKKKTRIDGAEINKSLLALKECIRALDQAKKHLPFRGSKLTQVLKDSFVGNCRTVMIGNIGPCTSCCEHTLNTLRYADRVKELKNENRGKSDEMMLARGGGKSTIEIIKKKEHTPAMNDLEFIKKKSGPSLMMKQKTTIGNKFSSNNLRESQDPELAHQTSMDSGLQKPTGLMKPTLLKRQVTQQPQYEREPEYDFNPQHSQPNEEPTGLYEDEFDQEAQDEEMYYRQEQERQEQERQRQAQAAAAAAAQPRAQNRYQLQKPTAPAKKSYAPQRVQMEAQYQSEQPPQYEREEFQEPEEVFTEEKPQSKYQLDNPSPPTKEPVDDGMTDFERQQQEERLMFEERMRKQQEEFERMQAQKYTPRGGDQASNEQPERKLKDLNQL